MKIFVGALLLILTCAAQAERYGAIDFEPCRLGAHNAQLTVQALCGVLSVPEKRNDPSGRQIDLAVAWIRAAHADPQADPLIFIAGGPGQSALDSYPLIHHALAGVRTDHSIVLMDQRGTGQSNPLGCNSELGNNDALSIAIDDTDLKRLLDSCLASLRAHADPRFYTTTDAVADLEDFRTALGSPPWNMLGVSYGTRVIQQFAKTFPNAVRTMILDGVVPNAVLLGSDHARFLDSTLDHYFSACTDADTCSALSHSNRARLHAITERLKTQAVTVRFRHAISGQWQEQRINHEQVGLVMRLFAYQPTTAALLPLLLTQMEQGQFETIAALSHMQGDSLNNAMALAMSLAVSCTEDARELTTHTVDAHSVMGEHFVAQLKRICTQWPTGDMPKDFHQPLQSDLPTLLLSGEYDPVTPPAYGDLVARSLSHSTHLIVPGQGHSVSGVGCVPKLIAQFINTTEGDKLDTSCIAQRQSAPIVVDLYGPAP